MGRFLYNDNTTTLFARFGACSPRKILKKIVSFDAFLFISGSDFVLTPERPEGHICHMFFPLHLLHYITKNHTLISRNFSLGSFVHITKKILRNPSILCLLFGNSIQSTSELWSCYIFP